jgi:hypothetical protein
VAAHVGVHAFLTSTPTLLPRERQRQRERERPRYPSLRRPGGPKADLEVEENREFIHLIFGLMVHSLFTILSSEM